MKLLSVAFKSEVRLYGAFCAPKSISMDNKEDRDLWDIGYDPRFRVIEVTIKKQGHNKYGQTFVVPCDKADSWRFDPNELAGLNLNESIKANKR